MFIDRRVAILAVALLSGCRDRSCQDLTERRDYPAAATTCARTFARGGDPAAGISAVQAFSNASRNQDALALASQLLAGPRGAEARRLMARIYLKQEQFDAARSLLEEALHLDQKAGQHAAAYADVSPLVTAYWNRSDFGNALPLANLAVTEADASGDPKLCGTALIALGSVFQAAGDTERALDAYARATARLPSNDRADRARVLLYRGTILTDQRQHALARPLLEQARALATELGEHSMLLAAEVNLASVALGRRDLAAAERHLEGAQAAGRARGDRTTSQGILINRAILERLRGDFAAASRAIDAAAAGNPPPENAWIIAHERGLVAAAAHDTRTAERSYRTAIDLIEALWRTSSPEELKAPYFEERWGPYQSLFALQVERGDADAAFATLITAQGRMFQADAIAASAGGANPAGRRDHVRSLMPLVTASPLARTFSPADTLAQLGERYALDYFAGGGRMRLLILDHGSVKLASTDIELATLEKLVDDFLANPDDRRSAEALGKALLPPEALAAAPTRFHIIADGPLLRVPFAALIAGGARLVEHHELVYAPSATGLAGLGTSPPAPPTRAIVLSDARNNLEHSTQETASVVAATRATAWIGRMATTAALRAAHDASLLHIVGHSGVGIDGGFLLLADGQVSAADILAWQIRPRLVVLSSCASAATERRDMWGSLAAAFLAAGSSDVVATLFSVEDPAAAEFTALFYGAGGERDPVAATAAAQRAMASHRSASAWSAFTVVGL